MKRIVLILGVALVVLGSGVAAAAVLAGGGSPSPSPGKGQPLQQTNKDSDENEGGVHGGPIERFHTGSACDLVDVSTLPENWTHGDYVSAVAALGDDSLVPIAAHSDCGKPVVATGHRHGPPDFVPGKDKANPGNDDRDETSAH